MHRITNLKKPAEQVKSLTVGVNTAEKHLLAAGEKLAASKLALAAAEEAVKTDLKVVEDASTAFQDVKEKLEGAETALKEFNAAKSRRSPWQMPWQR